MVTPSMSSQGHGMAGRLASAFINSRLTPLLMLVSILLGVGATVILPREEEPQITVPMADVFVAMPGASPQEVEQRVTYPMEKLIRELPGVEYVYSTSRPGESMVVVRFYVGTDPEDAIVQLYTKLYANLDRIPPGVSNPLVKARSIDDVPILALTLSSSSLEATELRRVAAQLDEQIKQVDDVAETTLIGGLRRELRVELDPSRLAAYSLSPAAVAQALAAHNTASRTGQIDGDLKSIPVKVDAFLHDPKELGQVVVAVRQGRPVYLSEVANIVEAGPDPATYVLHGTGPALESGHEAGLQQAVTISIAKRPGANAISVAEAVLAKMDKLKETYLPSGVELTVTRNYGETAAERSNELLYHMGIAVVSVTLLIWLALGRRESAVVAVAIPVTLALTLATFVLYDFTLNRVT
ncbi:MAG: efflux RND transporter permease subunit, partial [Candidatus Eremiobacteraeota bacterium]|nr:efflux RND transporter permease subunit [Candidatus Eremiobacteraeota bacterium]